MFSELFFVVQIDNNFMFMDNYLATGGGANYCNQRLYVYQFLFVCLSLSVWLLAYHKNHV